MRLGMRGGGEEGDEIVILQIKKKASPTIELAFSRYKFLLWLL